MRNKIFNKYVVIVEALVISSMITIISHAQFSGDSLMKNAAFTVKANRYGLSEIGKTNDVHATNYVRRGKVFGDVTVRYIHNKQLDTARAFAVGNTSYSFNGNTVATWEAKLKDSTLQVSQDFTLDGDALTWKINLQNTSTSTIRIEDLAIPFFYNAGGGENPVEIFEQRVVKHHFISGNNSFIFWERPTGLGPYLVMVPLPGTSLEYFSTNATDRSERGAFMAYIHAALAVNMEQRGTWRQPNTSATIAAKATRTYGFKFRWAKDYAGIRDILLEEGLIDVQVMPGMTVPNNLEAMIALRTHQHIDSIVPEFGGVTAITKLPSTQAATQLYKIKFARLGENKLTINYGNHYKTYLEFFVTEPLETLYKKRASFIANHQQHKAPGKWYDGLFGVYDMKNAQLRGPDNADFFDTSRLSYVLTCDDPGLCKAPFVAAKNVVYPNQQEIDAVEYYIEHFVWGGLQRTDQELPNPYGVYGTPNWPTNRDTATRLANLKDPNREKMHIWRSYDYPHIMMMYYHMYQVASMYPTMTHYLDAKGYLIRAKETAKAYFKYPYEILPWYETYKWGCYNELLIPQLAEDIRKAGYTDDADFLTKEWEKKVKYFLYDDKYPFRSEYAIDATAFESSHALAMYAMEHQMQPDSNLWFDKNLKRWYSHPKIEHKDAVDFMDRQLQANLALRGVLEPAYYFMGSDFRGRSDAYTLSYMSQMGGWAVLDYALKYSDAPADYIRSGYQSYLSSFALINSGTPESNYGYWYPGKENDGASGWAFEPQQYANTWIQKPQGRGPWYYDGEIDLGFGGATRAAATVVTNDPVFGNVAYGGSLNAAEPIWSLIPKDGLQQRLFFRLNTTKVDLELNRDGFASGQVIEFDPAMTSISFQLENRSGDAHSTTLSVKGMTGHYTIMVNGKTSSVVLSHEETIQITVVPKGLTKVTLIKK